MIAADDCVNVFNDLKLKHKHAYVVYKMDATFTRIVVETTADKEATYDDFVKALPKDDCRFAVLDYAYNLDGAPRNKIVFVAWYVLCFGVLDKESGRGAL